ncbi:hypothetical protein R3P38DRAFT_2799628 [Favolaschia claudopus]|uniref:Uncharacterized protein n=1 Tax=Favolaschia claudopus TaxID=2862362 RepID=A0AAW0A0A4_9AGAR
MDPIGRLSAVVRGPKSPRVAEGGAAEVARRRLRTRSLQHREGGVAVPRRLRGGLGGGVGGGVGGGFGGGPRGGYQEQDNRGSLRWRCGRRHAQMCICRQAAIRDPILSTETFKSEKVAEGSADSGGGRKEETNEGGKTGLEVKGGQYKPRARAGGGDGEVWRRLYYWRQLVVNGTDALCMALFSGGVNCSAAWLTSVEAEAGGGYSERTRARHGKVRQAKSPARY